MTDAPGRTRRVTGRTLGAALFGAFVAVWLARAVAVWILGVEGTWAAVVLATAAVLGVGLALALDAEERRAGRSG